MVTSFTRSGDGSVSREKAQLEAAKILNFVNQLRPAALRISTRGIAASQIEVNSGDPWNPCTTGQNCIFGRDGGDAVLINLDYDVDRDIEGMSGWNYADVGDNVTVLDVGTNAPDIVLYRLFKIGPRAQRLCTEMNKMLGISGIPLVDASNVALATFPAAPGKPVACLQHYTDHYVFYATVLEY